MNGQSKSNENNDLKPKEILFINREKDSFAGNNDLKFNFRNFNKKQKIKSYIEEKERIQLIYEDDIISDANVIINQEEIDLFSISLGWITSVSTKNTKSHIGIMTYLIATIVYILLNDEDLINKNIKIELDICSEANEILKQHNIDVYYHIFRTNKYCNEPEKTHREYIFKQSERKNDIVYFKKILETREVSILKKYSRFIKK